MGVVEGVNAVADLARKYDKLDLYQQAVDLMEQVRELADENRRLATEGAELKKALEIRGALVCRENKYYLKTSEAEDGPFCTCCYDTKRLLVRLQAMPGYVPSCPSCKTCHFSGAAADGPTIHTVARPKPGVMF